MKNFRVLTTNFTLQNIDNCTLSDSYTGDLRLNSVLPEFQLSNLVDSEYLDMGYSTRQNWKEFFLKLNPKIELNSVDIVKRKVELIANSPNLVTLQNVLHIWKTIIEFKEELLKTHKEQLQKIPILFKNGTIGALSDYICYFPNEYNPVTDTETLLLGHDHCLISPVFLIFDDNIK